MAKHEPALELISAKDVKVRPVKWLWPFFIPKGKITLLQGDPGDGKADELLRSLDICPGAGRPNDRLQEAKSFLEELLADGSMMLADECMNRLKESDICRSTANSAKRELGILSVRMNERWYWKLPQAE